jgi:3-hydroxyisobutyrate dehydrogenase
MSNCAFIGLGVMGYPRAVTSPRPATRLLQGLSEGIDFARRAGLDVDAVVDTISKGAAGS